MGKYCVVEKLTERLKQPAKREKLLQHGKLPLKNQQNPDRAGISSGGLLTALVPKL